MTRSWHEGPEQGWKRAAVGGISGGAGFLIAKSFVGDGGLEIAVATGAVTLVLMLAISAAVAR
ncbi:hypothetical protein [Halorussus litoreus]|uniref:hypothetical protein n=1 Tax=Halorussus litoreus TaxID=1710536 RepID=UPI000E254340|nr:hypothetical protein [Halorussus litoreus]